MAGCFQTVQPLPASAAMKYCRRSARIVTSPISAKAAEADEGFFDTSVLVPVFYGDHVHHQASLALFIQFDKSPGCCGAPSLAAVYSTLTRRPGKHRISAEQAMLFVGSIRERLSLIALDGDEYADALQFSSALG